MFLSFTEGWQSIPLGTPWPVPLGPHIVQTPEASQSKKRSIIQEAQCMVKNMGYLVSNGSRSFSHQQQWAWNWCANQKIKELWEASGCFLPGSGEAAGRIFASSLLLSDRKRKKDHLKAPGFKWLGQSARPSLPWRKPLRCQLRNKCVPTVSWRGFPRPCGGGGFRRCWLLALFSRTASVPVLIWKLSPHLPLLQCLP